MSIPFQSPELELVSLNLERRFKDKDLFAYEFSVHVQYFK